MFETLVVVVVLVFVYKFATARVIHVEFDKPQKFKPKEQPKQIKPNVRRKSDC